MSTRPTDRSELSARQTAQQGDKSAQTEPIAIIGIGCRFPGGADTPESFWELLCTGTDAIGEMPSQRGTFDIESYYDPMQTTPGKIASREGGFLPGIDQFDAAFFGISPREAVAIDPQQRILLEIAWEALEDAGLAPYTPKLMQTGVFVGMWTSDYEARMFGASDNIDLYVTTGGGRYSAAGRLSFALDFRGPSLTIDTACSSSLVAVHLASASLRRGECIQAVAGGVNLILQPQITIGYSRSGMLSPDGRCKFGDASANGYVRSEGAGMVVLKLLSQAVADGDRIYATIHGSAVNNDGHSGDLLVAPSGAGQEAMLREAYRQAGISPGQVAYMEAHGTGTTVGDRVEVQALGAVLAEDRPLNQPCLIGSVKTNIGHTEAAAGVAGLIKAALSLHHGLIPPSLHFREPNPAIPWDRLPLTVQRDLTPWPVKHGPAFAAVNSFGVTGTNAHAVLGEPPPSDTHISAASPDSKAMLLPISARSSSALTALAGRYRALLTANDANLNLADVCYSASVRRTHHEYRTTAVGRSTSDLADQLGRFQHDAQAGAPAVERVREEHPRIVFVFPGQGAQWFGMAQRLLASETVFRTALERCGTAFEPDVDWSLIEQLQADEADSRLNEINVVQPTLFAIQVALTEQWRAWGIEPDAVVGHSMGEAAAAFAAGILSLEDAARVICRRSQLLRRISGQGAMAVVDLSLEQARQAIVGFEDRLAIAVSNSPRSTVLSGDPGALDDVLDTLERRNVFCRRVKVDVASHSPQVDVLRKDLLAALGEIRPRTARIPFYSTVRGARIDGLECDAAYWIQNLRQPVLFADAIRRLVEDDHDAFIELSPHPILLQPIETTCHALGRQVATLPSMLRNADERTALLQSLGALYSLGQAIDWDALYPDGGRRTDLPTYPWQRERYWMDAPAGGVPPAGWTTSIGGSGEYDPLLGTRLPEIAARPDAVGWQRQIDAGLIQKLVGHQAASGPAVTALPSQSFSTLALAAAKACFGSGRHTVASLTLLEPLLIEPSAPQTLQILLDPSADSGTTLQVFSRRGVGTRWTCHAEARLTIDQLDPDLLYSVEWRQQDPIVRDPIPQGSLADGSWIIFTDRGGVGATLADRLQRAGGSVALVEAASAVRLDADHAGACAIRSDEPEDYDRLLGHLRDVHGDRSRGVLFLWGLDLPSTDALDAATVQASVVSGARSLLYLTQALVRAGWVAPPRLWTVIRGVEAIEGDSRVSVAQAPLCGLARVIGLEHPDAWGGLIDLPSETENALDAVLDGVVGQVTAPDDEDHVAFRSGRRFVARLTQSTVQVDSPPMLALHTDATYLITGGVGSLGLQIANWLVDRGARRLILTSRSGLPDRATWDSAAISLDLQRRVDAVRALEARGAAVSTPRVDVADSAGMAALFAELRRSYPPIRGIIHAAGTITTQSVAELTAEALDEVMRSKVAGAWTLHELTRDLAPVQGELDFFVCFSSAASVWGSQQLAHYGAANRFLDALAQHRCSIGLPALSVNWGSWAGGGMATGDLGNAFGQAGLSAIPTPTALAALGYLIEAGISQQTVASVDWSRFKPLYEARRHRPLISELGQSEAVPTPVAQERRSDFLAEWEQALPSQRPALVTTLVQTVAAGILGFAEPAKLDRTQGFFKLGMDSIMTVQLHKQLQISLGRSLPPTLAFEYPTVASLAAHLASELQTSAEVAPPEGPRHANQDERVPDMNLDDLNADELLALFDKEFEAASNYAEKDREIR